MNDTNQQLEQVYRPVPKPSERTNVAAALITTAVWATVGAFAGRMIGSVGDRWKTTGPGKTVGMLVGGITAGAIAFGTSLKIIGQDKDKHKDLEFSNAAHAVGSILPTEVTPMNALTLPSTLINQGQLQGIVMPEPLDKAR